MSKKAIHCVCSIVQFTILHRILSLSSTIPRSSTHFTLLLYARGIIKERNRAQRAITDIYLVSDSSQWHLIKKMKMKKSPFDVLLRKGRARHHGSISGLPFSEPVRVMRDGFGIPHIFAQNERDLMAAQGFVHAQDRLWQMEITRRFASGTLAETAGEEALELDLFTRLAGFDRLKKRALLSLPEEGKTLYRAYAKGVNACISSSGSNLPIEFRKLKLIPVPWKIEDSAASLSLNAWFLQTNYQEEVLALLCRKRITADQWNELFPSSPGEELPAEDFFSRFRDVKIGKILPEALAYYRELSVGNGASNNWITSDPKHGHVLLANDPHLSLTVPQIWYFCHLHCPTLHVCGASMPGTPGIIIGRNERISWGITNVMTDCVDLYILKVDPKNPSRYYIKDRAYEMKREELAIPIKGEKLRDYTLFRTVHGTVITGMEVGVEAVVTLKWYGTLEEDEFSDSTIHGFLSLMRAGSVKEAFEACSAIKSVGQNFVIGDTEGNIGWHTTGSVPLRRGYSGRLPADGSSGEHRWDGFLPYNKMPHSYNPLKKRITTANHKTTHTGHPVSHSWCAPYRYERILHLLDEHPSPTAEDFQKIQMDSYSLQAEKMLPAVLGFSPSDSLAREAQNILQGWGCNMEEGSRPALVFNVFLVEFARLLLGSLLGDSLPLFFSLMGYIYSGVDTVLTSGGDSAQKLLDGQSLESLCEQALTRAMRFLQRTLGKNREKWSWGLLHRYHFCHPGGRGHIASWLLNRGPYPAPGNGSTVNVSLYNPGHRGGSNMQYTVHTTPSLRMVADLSHPDRTYLIGPMGQSGQPGSRHYADMIDPWRKGELVPLPLSRDTVERIAVHTLELFP